MIPYLTFKFEDYVQLLKEFQTKLDPKLIGILATIASYMWQKYEIETVITCLVRSIQYNSDMGGRELSAHIIQDGYYCRAADIRTRHLTRKQIKDLIGFIESLYGNKVCIVYEGDHIHVNINWQWATAA